MARRLKHWGWGYEDEQPPYAELQATGGCPLGREHRPWYDRQRPEPFAAALRAAKAAVDPRGLLNPDVLIDFDR